MSTPLRLSKCLPGPKTTCCANCDGHFRAVFEVVFSSRATEMVQHPDLSARNVSAPFAVLPLVLVIQQLVHDTQYEHKIHMNLNSRTKRWRWKFRGGGNSLIVSSVKSWLMQPLQHDTRKQRTAANKCADGRACTHHTHGLWSAPAACLNGPDRCRYADLQARFLAAWLQKGPVPNLVPVWTSKSAGHMLGRWHR